MSLLSENLNREAAPIYDEERNLLTLRLHHEGTHVALYNEGSDEDDVDYEYSEGSDSESWGSSLVDSDYDVEGDEDGQGPIVEGTKVAVGEGTKGVREKKRGQGRIEEVFKKKKEVMVNQNAGYGSGSEIDDGKGIDGSESDFESLHGSDEEVGNPTLVFNPKDMYNPPIKCGMLFNNFNELKAAIRSWNIRRGRRFKFIKNDQSRVRCKCPMAKCKWLIYASKVTGENTVKVKTFVEKHNCKFLYNNKSVTSTWVADKYVEVIRENPKLDSMRFRRQVMRENRFYISRLQGYRARRKALKIIQGAEPDQYSKLHSYIAEICRTNPGSTVIMKVEDRKCVSWSRFQRMYVCFSGVKQGYITACRKIFGLDGTFLKGPCGGILLTAVGIDPNNGYYPIAYAVTEGENLDSWDWFLTLLRDDLQIENDEDWCIMSDKQKGLVQACGIVFPNADHRFCVKHLHGNLSSAGFKGKAIKRAMWAAAKSTTPAQFKHKMKVLGGIDSEAACWLTEKAPQEWSRSHFRTDIKCSMLVNNNCESFNSRIVDYRDLPILGMLEGIRMYILERMQENRDRAREKWGDNLICPRIFKIVENHSAQATLCVPHKANDDNIEVWCPYGEQYAVCISDRTCTCRRWQLTGIPCCHAISAIWCVDKEPVDFVHDYYTVERYLACYNHCILPLSGEHDWPESDAINPLPPLYGRAPGRPRKSRVKGAAEIVEGKENRLKASRVGQLNKCSKCGKQGHNKRSCKEILEENEEFITRLGGEDVPEILEPFSQPETTCTNKNLTVKRKRKCSQGAGRDAEASEPQGAVKSGVKSLSEAITEDIDLPESSSQAAKRLSKKAQTQGQMDKKGAQNPTAKRTKHASQQDKAKKGAPTTECINISSSAPPLKDNGSEIKEKYEMFGLPVPKFVFGTKPKLSNTKKKQPNKPDSSATDCAPAVVPPVSSDIVLGWQSVYEAFDIPIPSYFSDKELMQQFGQQEKVSETGIGSSAGKKDHFNETSG